MENYYIRFKEQIEEADKSDKRPSLLLHACCCPCSSHCLELLVSHFDITVFFYNPNIDEQPEYQKRLDELYRFTKEADFARDVKIIDGGYDPEPFFEMAKGREDLPERGARCYDCYKLRMQKTIEYATENGFDYFSTTLSISPYKNAEWLNEIGMELERKQRAESEARVEAQADSEADSIIPTFLFSDFKKENGYKRSIELSKEYNLYRQDYCDCKFSKRDRDKKKQQSSRSL